MEPLLVAADLRRLGVGYLDRDARPTIGLRVDDERRLVPLADGDPVPVIVGDVVHSTRLEPISALFRGDRRPPRFHVGPTPEYALFFHAIETTIADCALHLEPPPTDQEFEQLYRQLRRRPDAPTGAAPVLSYMRAAVRLYMSLVDVSRAELDAVLNELGRSARRHASGHASRSYVTLLQDLFVG